jgi:predicted nucleic acid-binding Zn ribbon protein
MSDEPLKVCPSCSQAALKKVVYAAGVVFKGSGFYTTDYKGSGSKASENGSAPATDKGSEAKPESKPEAKSESKSDSGD